MNADKRRWEKGIFLNLRSSAFICGFKIFYGIALISAFLSAISVHAQEKNPDKLLLSRADYIDRVHAVWNAQIIACLMGFQFEHKVASVKWVDSYPKKYDNAPVDDDWYYEMCAVRAFEKFGIGLTIEQLGEQWKENSCGSWGSSEQARLNLTRGIKAPDCGHPRYNKLWFTIGPQFSAEVYGLLAPGMPNLAAQLARTYGHVNGYAEAVDGAVFMAGMVSLGFVETDPHVIVKKAVQLVHPASPYRKMLDEIIALAQGGRSAREIFDAVEDRWHLEYPASNNAVANGGIVAVAVWFGSGDFLKTINLIYRAADITDADCNAANAASVIAAMHGMKCLPAKLVEPLHDRILDEKLGQVKLTPPVDEKISELAKRTAAVGEKFITANAGHIDGETISITVQQPATQPAERFSLSDLMQFWNSEWKLERAGFGGAGGGVGNIRGITHLDGDVLATWPRDPVRGVVLRSEKTLGEHLTLSFQAGADAGRAWELEVYADNKRLLRKLIDGTGKPPGERVWEDVKIDLDKFAGQDVRLRLYQRVLLADRIPGNALWKNVVIK
jgi:hypothetical protein